MNAYCWDVAAQDRLIADTLEPLVRRLMRDRRVSRFWLGRFDTRGPHVTALLTCPSSGGDDVCDRVAAAAADHQRRWPSRALHTETELLARHLACRGKALWRADRDEGLAPNNTLRCEILSGDSYPFAPWRDAPRASELWRLWSSLALWGAAHVGGNRALGAAARWFAALDLALNRSGFDNVGYWRHHAYTLLLRIDPSLSALSPAAAATLGEAVGPGTLGAFDRALVEARAPRRPPSYVRLARGLVAVAADLSWEADGSARPLVREVTHGLMLELGVPVRLQIPLVLAAWSRSITRALGAVAR